MAKKTCEDCYCCAVCKIIIPIRSLDVRICFDGANYERSQKNKHMIERLLCSIGCRCKKFKPRKERE